MSGPKTSIHASAATGYGAAAATYVGGWPDYPPAVAAWLTDVVGLAPGRDVVDLGAGTGKFVPFLRNTGARVIAVEPVPAMRDELTRRHPEVEALDGTGEHIPLGAGSVDAVVCAQSFHWFATPTALAEIRRVLRPGGVLGLIWNVRDETVPWVAALSRVTDPHEAGTPRYRSGAWRRLFPADGFTAIDERSAGHAHVGDVEDVVVGRTLSVSFIAALPASERAVVEQEVRDLIRETPALRSQPVRFPYTTVMVAFRRVEAA